MMSVREETNFRFNLKENRATLKSAIKLSLWGLLALTLYVLTCYFILQIFSNRATEHSKFFFYEKSPDLIAVFTGDKGRLDEAFKILEKYPESKLLISGVYNKNTLRILLAEKRLTLSEEQISQVVEIDYLSRNTLENVLATLQEFKKDHVLKNALIISSDYHLLRIKLLFSILSDKTLSVQTHFLGVQSEASIIARIIDSSAEGLKIIKTLLISLFWDIEPT